MKALLALLVPKHIYISVLELPEHCERTHEIKINFSWMNVAFSYTDLTNGYPEPFHEFKIQRPIVEENGDESDYIDLYRIQPMGFINLSPLLAGLMFFLAVAMPMTGRKITSSQNHQPAAGD